MRTGPDTAVRDGNADLNYILIPLGRRGLPNPDITHDNVADNICNRNWSTKSIRPPVDYTDPLKLQQMTEYGDTVSDLTGLDLDGEESRVAKRMS